MVFILMSAQQAALQLVQYLQAKKWKIRCVESCTAGALVAAIGQISGISSILDRSWVTYSNQAKIEEVAVSHMLFAQYGAVSSEVVCAMAEGAVRGCEHDTLAIAVSGIAGPTGGSKEKPIGTIWIGIKKPQHPAMAYSMHFAGERIQIQQQAVVKALQLALAEFTTHADQTH